MYRCTDCGLLFTSYQVLSDHVCTKHSDEEESAAEVLKAIVYLDDGREVVAGTATADRASAGKVTIRFRDIRMPPGRSVVAVRCSATSTGAEFYCRMDPVLRSLLPGDELAVLFSLDDVVTSNS